MGYARIFRTIPQKAKTKPFGTKAFGPTVRAGIVFS
jgi:hypothetical protein